MNFHNYPRFQLVIKIYASSSRRRFGTPGDSRASLHLSHRAKPDFFSSRFILWGNTLTHCNAIAFYFYPASLFAFCISLYSSVSSLPFRNRCKRPWQIKYNQWTEYNWHICRRNFSGLACFQVPLQKLWLFAFKLSFFRLFFVIRRLTSTRVILSGCFFFNEFFTWFHRKWMRVEISNGKTLEWLTFQESYYNRKWKLIN